MSIQSREFDEFPPFLPALKQESDTDFADFSEASTHEIPLAESGNKGSEPAAIDTIPAPHNITEAQLLLATARVDC
ncbi:hypothetical protein SCLCIDRAFT_22482 [Scleroderma citrinum Foug A]|uniref:Uncharacterized protein n=1 Tax=Scleroderma citrinum Foug A TaxID=1036808 RepID=A0A0C3ALZ1_9AGAM|nr:hypothetical protein SCLCIDRAFT_22482 [Scleroderma citrinum Foug A]